MRIDMVNNNIGGRTGMCGELIGHVPIKNIVT